MTQAESKQTKPGPGACIECGSDHVVDDVCYDCGVVQPDPVFGEEGYAPGSQLDRDVARHPRHQRYVAVGCGHSTRPMRMRGNQVVPTRGRGDYLPRGTEIQCRIYANLKGVLAAAVPDADAPVRQKVHAIAMNLYRKCCQFQPPRNHVSLGMTCLLVAMRTTGFPLPLRQVFDAIASQGHWYSKQLFYKMMLTYRAMFRGAPIPSFETYLGGVLDNAISLFHRVFALNGQRQAADDALRACVRWIVNQVRQHVRGQNPVAVAAAIVYNAGWLATKPHAWTQIQVARLVSIHDYSLRDTAKFLDNFIDGKVPPMPPVVLRGQAIPETYTVTYRPKETASMNPEIAKQVVDLLATSAPLARDAMVPMLNIPRTTLFDTMSVMVQNGQLVVKKALMGRQGRPKVLYSLPGGS